MSTPPPPPPPGSIPPPPPPLPPSQRPFKLGGKKACLVGGCGCSVVAFVFLVLALTGLFSASRDRIDSNSSYDRMEITNNAAASTPSREATQVRAVNTTVEQVENFSPESNIDDDYQAGYRAGYASGLRVKNVAGSGASKQAVSMFTTNELAMATHYKTKSSSMRRGFEQGFADATK